MRVLLLSEVLHPETVGGAGRAVRELAAHLAKFCDVTLLSRAGKFPAEPPAGVRLIRVPPPEGLAPLAMRRYRSAVRAALPTERFDIVHHHQPFIGWAAIDVPGPRVATFYSSWPAEYVVKHRGSLLSRAAARILRSIEAGALARADRWIVLSEHSRRELREFYPGLDRPTTRIPGGVDPSHFRIVSPEVRAATRRELNLPAGAFLLLTVRNLVPRMGLGNLVQAMERLRDVPDLHLAVAGDGALRAELETSARAHGIASRVTFLGRVDEARLPDLYGSADLFVLPTETLEGFGLVILEAFASGVPVAATPVGAIPELVGLAGSGFLFGGVSPEAIAEGLRGLLGRRGEFAALAPRLRAVAEEHSWAHTAEATRRLYEELVASRS